MYSNILNGRRIEDGKTCMYYCKWLIVTFVCTLSEESEIDKNFIDPSGRFNDSENNNLNEADF